MRETSNWKGQLAVSKAEVRAMELGLVPSRPLMDCRYDLVIDDGTRLWRVQVKYADDKPACSVGSVIVKLAYETRNRKIICTYSNNEVDALIVYIPKIDRLCWFPCEVFVGKKVLCVRIAPSLNSQKSRVYYANNYLW